MGHSAGGSATPGDWLALDTDGLGEPVHLRLRNGFEVHRRAHNSFRMEQLPACSHHVVGLRLAGVCTVERLLDGERSATTSRSGCMSIVPAGRVTAWSVNGSGEFACFFIPAPLFDDICRQEAQIDTSVSPALCDRFAITDPQIQSVAHGVIREMDSGLSQSSLFAEALMIQMTTWLARRHTHACDEAKPARRVEPLGRRLVRLVGDYVEENLAADISIDELAALAGMSRSHFSHRFKASFGQSPHQYVLFRRVERARNLLATTDMPVAEIALACGFADQAHMSTAFKRHAGLTPALFRAEARK